MCGIAGYVRVSGMEPGPARLLRMLRTMRTRGPDDEGLVLVAPEPAPARSFRTRESAPGVLDCLLDPGAGIPHAVALGHRRFSIVDLSPAAHQPFWSTDRAVCVAFNGEIYNYVELRDELRRAGRRFRTDSDTEVLVEAYLAWGEQAFCRLNGFWAIAFYDARQGRVLLARDRIGKAPLYVTAGSDGLYWCSEIKGLIAALGSQSFSANDQAVDDFVRFDLRDVFHGTFYEQVVTFPAAAIAWIEPDGTYRPRTYWSLPARRRSEREISIPEAVRCFRDTLSDAVRIRLRADVPVGFELSGGLDSSSIVAAGVAARPGEKLDVFTVSYRDSRFDELPFAAAVTRHFGDVLHPTVLEPQNASFLHNLDEFVAHMDEPYHDPVLHNAAGIWHSMRDRGFRVSLSGAAGDEVFAGYGSDYFLFYLKRLLRRGALPRMIIELIRYSEHATARLSSDHLRLAYKLFPSWLRLYRNRSQEVPPRIDPYIRGRGVESRGGPSEEICRRLVDRMTHWRMNYWCRGGNQLCMGVPLEYRCPYLDYRLVELGFSLPLSYLIRDGWMKWIVRRAMEGVLPREIVWRRQKGGFRYPLGERLPECRGEMFHLLTNLDCPYLSLPRLRDHYEELTRRNPNYLWRLFSLAFWWKRCVQGQRLLPADARRGGNGKTHLAAAMNGCLP